MMSQNSEGNLSHRKMKALKGISQICANRQGLPVQSQLLVRQTIHPNTHTPLEGLP
jgi:hypothetical protein